jgi:predicted negative regulator of RcsB-dependent stress response
MLNMLTAPGLTLVFLGVIVGLGTAFVWVFWQIEQAASKTAAKPHRNGDRLG